MGTVRLSTRLTEEESKKLDALAAELGLDRPAMLKQLIRRGYRDTRIETALNAYRRKTVTLSRAAEMAELSIREMLLCLPVESVELNYGLDDLNRDLDDT